MLESSSIVNFCVFWHLRGSPRPQKLEGKISFAAGVSSLMAERDVCRQEQFKQKSSHMLHLQFCFFVR